MQGKSSATSRDGSPQQGRLHRSPLGERRQHFAGPELARCPRGAAPSSGVLVLQREGKEVPCVRSTRAFKSPALKDANVRRVSVRPDTAARLAVPAADDRRASSSAVPRGPPSVRGLSCPVTQGSPGCRHCATRVLKALCYKTEKASFLSHLCSLRSVCVRSPTPPAARGFLGSLGGTCGCALRAELV